MPGYSVIVVLVLSGVGKSRGKDLPFAQIYMGIFSLLPAHFLSFCLLHYKTRKHNGDSKRIPYHQEHTIVCDRRRWLGW